MHIPTIPIRSRAGFTIIEVMIVLIIAAIVLLIIFLAVPALQRNSRNNDRRSDISRLGAAWQEFKVHNQGMPATDSTADRNRLLALANSNTLTTVRVNPNNNTVSGSGDTDTAYMRVGVGYSGGKCNEAGTNAGGDDPQPGQVAIVYYIETASGRRGQCLQL